jgi:hypothetical protein
LNEPRRLSQSGGVSQWLLDSASIDKPSEAARRRAALLAATASSFSRSASGSVSATRPRRNLAKTLGTWVLVAAAASATLALVGSRLLDAVGGGASHPAAGQVLAELPQAPSAAPPRSLEITAEPNVAVKTPSIAATPPAPASASPSASASADEARQIEAARAATARGDDAAAIATLDAFDKAYPNSALKPESIALRALALKHRAHLPR